MQDDIWTVKRILTWIEGYLTEHGDENPRLSAQWLVADALGCNRMQLFMDFERPLDEGERAILRDYTRRRGTGEPLQYITGTTDFRYITVGVRESVLIPRPETEVLVSEALALLPAQAKPQDALDAALIEQYKAYLEEDDSTADDAMTSASENFSEQQNFLIADIGTGSGCIACSIAYERADAHVIATDISPVACALARENVERLNLAERVDVCECDLGEGVDAQYMGSFDLVVSNPPYVPTSVLADMPHEVSAFEPVLALDGGLDGLDVFRRLLAWSDQALKPGGGLAVELHETCLDKAAKIAADAGWNAVRVQYDLAGKPRVLTACKAQA